MATGKLELYQDFKEKMAGLSSIKHYGYWNNQVSEDNEKQEKPFFYPAVFIEFDTIEYGQNQQTQQIYPYGNTQKQQKPVPCSVIIHCCFSQLEKASDSFEIIDPIVHEVYLALQFMEGTLYQNMYRTSETPDVDFNRVSDWQIVFSTALSEDGELGSLTETTVTGITLTTDLLIESGTTSSLRTSGATSTYLS